MHPIAWALRQLFRPTPKNLFPRRQMFLSLVSTIVYAVWIKQHKTSDWYLG
jgi:hypothetical protein